MMRIEDFVLLFSQSVAIVRQKQVEHRTSETCHRLDASNRALKPNPPTEPNFTPEIYCVRNSVKPAACMCREPQPPNHSIPSHWPRYVLHRCTMSQRR